MSRTALHRAQAPRRALRAALAGWLTAVSWLTFAGSASAQSLYAKTVEDRSHVTVMEFGGVYDRQPEANRTYEQAVREAIAKEFFRTHADDYDMLVTFTRFPYALGTDGEGLRVGGRYYSIKNDVQGIGLDLFDYSAQAGSRGRLQGYIDMGQIDSRAADPTDPSFEETLSVLAHEFAHRWSAFAAFQDAGGARSMALLGRDGAHWSFLLNSQNSVMYGNEWRDNGDGTFTAVGRSRSFYSPLDLYLMGMLDRSQVPPFTLIDSPDVEPDRLPEVGATITGTARTVTIDDVIAALGERVPSAANAPKRFKLGFIFLVRPGETADGLELSRINAIRDGFATRMVILTGGKLIAEVYPDALPAAPDSPPAVLPPSSGARSTPTDLVQGVDWLLAQQAQDGAFRDTQATAVRDTANVLDLLREIPSTYLSHQRGLAWLTSLTAADNVDTVSRRTLALSPQYAAPDATFLIEAENALGGWGLRRGYLSDPLDTALALRALADVGQASGLLGRRIDVEIRGTRYLGVQPDIGLLLSTQNEDGGWGLKPGASSSILATAAVMRLGERYADSHLNAALASAFAWLSAQQRADGGFGDHASTPYETAEAALILLKTTFPKASLIAALDYLRGTQLADGSWNESVYQTALAIRALKTAELPNASVSASQIVMMPASPVEGQAVALRVHVANDGVQEFRDVVVRIFDGDPAAGGALIGSDVTIPLLPPLAQVPVEVVWDTTGLAGEHRIVVVVDPDNAIVEYNEADNRAEKTIVVRTPPVEPDLAVVTADLAFLPVFLQTIPQSEILSVRVTNNGQTAASGVVLRVYDGDPATTGVQVGETTVDVPGRGHAPASVSFDVTRTGSHRYWVVLDPTNAIVEADETNNRAAITLPVQSTLDFFVNPASVTLSQSPIALGTNLVVSATVGNSGTTDAFGVQLRVSLDDPAGAIDLGTQTLDLPSGAMRPVSITWRTSRAVTGAPVVIRIDADDRFPENSEANNAASVPLTVQGSTAPNLRVAYQDLVVSAPTDQGGTATISVPVSNNGFADATNVDVVFYEGAPEAGGVAIGATQRITSLAPGAQTLVSTTWGPIQAAGTRLITVVVDPVNALSEFDEEDNSAFVTAIVRSRPDLSVTGASLAFSPAFPRAGDVVAITASVSNLGDQPASNVRARFFDGDPASGGAQIGTDQVIATIPGLGQGQVQAAYTASDLGTRAIWVQVDPLNEIVEQSEANNNASKTLGVQDASLYFSNVYFSPNGDGVQDSTDLFFRLDGAQSVSSVRILNRHGGLVQTASMPTPAPSSGSVPWDGTDDLGKVVADGEYTFVLVAPDGRDLASARAVVDNNALSVMDAFGTKYLLENNLTCQRRILIGDGYVVPYYEAGWLADDTGLVTWVPTMAVTTFYHWSIFGTYTIYAFSEEPVGVYVTAPDGASRRVTPDSWAIHQPAGDGTQILDVKISPDQQKVLIATYRYRINGYPYGGYNQFQVTSPVEYWVVNIDGSGLVRVVSASGSTATAQWAPDSTKFLFYNYDRNSADHANIHIVAADGSGETSFVWRDPAINDQSFNHAAWSKDGSRVLYSVLDVQPATAPVYANRVYAVNPDGTGKVVVGTSEIYGFGNLYGVIWLANDRFAMPTQGVMTPDGYFTYGNMEYGLWLFSTTGDAPQPLTPGISNISGEIAPSPDQRSIAFVGYGCGVNCDGGGNQTSTGIWRVGVEGRPEQVYAPTPDNQGIGFLKWSPDGSRLAFREIVITHVEYCDDGEGGEYFCGQGFPAAGIIDLADRSTNLIPLSPPGERYSWSDFQILGLFPEGDTVLIRDPASLTAWSPSVGRQTILPVDAYTWLNDARFTPSGKYLLYGSRRESFDASAPCWKGSYSVDTFAMTSLLNLTAQMTFQRQGSQIVIRGIAEDRNFADYRLEYAPVTAPTAWSPIGEPSEVPVINGELGRWIPPSEGAFFVRLLARDRAGNLAQARKRITWGLAPSITNVTVTPRMFSPNNDGSGDSVTINYLVLGPVHLEFAIYDGADRLVRTITQDHAVIGPASIAWDGRDDAGNFVTDGGYRIHVMDFDFFVTADSTPPSTALAIGNGFHTVPDRYECSDSGGARVCALRPGPLVEEPYRLLTGHAVDAELAHWTLEVGEGVNPSAWTVVDEGTGDAALRDARGNIFTPVQDAVLRRIERSEEAVNRKYRLTAVDQAGNRSVTLADLAPEEVILYAWDSLAVSTERILEQTPGSHLLSIEQTVRAPLSSLVVQYRLLGTTLWVDGAAVSLPGPRVNLPWNNSGLVPGRTYQVRVVGTDLDGRQLVSNMMAIHSNLFVMTGIDDETQVTQGIASLVDTLTEVRLVTAVGAEADIGTSVLTAPIPIDIAIAVNTSKLCEDRIPSIPVRYRGVGASGTVYYSNTLVAQGRCPGLMGGGLGVDGALRLEARTYPAPACGAPTPGSVQITLSSTGLVMDATLAVQSEPNGPLVDIPVSGLPFQTQIDTRTRPEGTYLVRAHGRLFRSDGDTADVSATARFIVDRVAPTAAITYPATNQLLCPIITTDRPVVAIEGIAEDANFDHYEVEFGVGESPTQWSPITQAAGQTIDTRAPRRGILANWDVTGLPGGTYTLRLNVYDQGGNLVCVTVTFTLADPMRVSNVTPDRRLFSPNGDGVYDSIAVAYQLNKTASVQARVYPVVNGQVGAMPVRSLLNNVQEAEGTSSVIWDGATDVGARAPDGVYAVVVTATDACGVIASASAQVEVDATPPDAAIESPLTTDVLPVIVEVLGIATDAHFERYRLEVWPDADPASVRLVAGTGTQVRSGRLGMWNTLGRGGAYTLRLTVTDFAGNHRESTVSVMVSQLDPLISSLAATPALFSPNGDGRLDTVVAEYGLTEDAVVVIDVLDAADAVIGTLVDATALRGIAQANWNGLSDAGAPAPDGTYRIRLRATGVADPTRTQTETVRVVIDATPPTVTPTTPADNTFLASAPVLAGTLSDLNLERYEITYGGNGPRLVFDEGTDNRDGVTFGPLAGLSDGPYSLTWSATDLAGNATERTTAFTLDTTSPAVTLTAPSDNAVVGGTVSNVEVRGSAGDVNLAEWTLRVGAGTDPATWTTLASGTAEPASDLLVTWDTTSVPDGTYTLSLIATDRAGTSAETRRAVVVDNTAPTANLSYPIDGATISTRVNLVGTAMDEHFVSALIEISAGDSGSAFQFAPMAVLSQAVDDDELTSWGTGTWPADGTYTLRLTVQDTVGLTTARSITVHLDTQPPDPPIDLTAQVETRDDVRLIWTASPSLDAIGYYVYRGGARITAAPVVGTTYLDQDLSDGAHRYTVTAVDQGGLESEPSNEARVAVDLTPPAVRIATPTNNAVVGGLVDIRGIAASDDFREYRILVGDGVAPASFTLVRRSPVPVTNGTLSEWDSVGRSESSLVTIRLEAEDLAGNVGMHQIAVTIDNLPPAAPTIISAAATGSDIAVEWSANTETDLAGYLLYNNDVVANVRRIVTGSVTPYLLSATTFADLGLPDGTYRYVVFALDQAGNYSDPSNTMTVTVETRPPRATIVSPATGTRTQTAVTLVATSPDQDVASVQFQFRAEAEVTWTDLGAPRAFTPYQTVWDPTGLPYGSYQFRAVATDVNINTDPAPPEITIIHQDLTPPGAPTGLAARVTESNLDLTWAANNETDLAGYHVYLVVPGSAPMRITPSPVLQPLLNRPDMSDENYTFTVTAVDSSGNESAPSSPAQARVYVVGLSAPEACVTGTETVVTGTGVTPGSVVTLYREDPAGGVLIGTATAGTDGSVQFAGVILPPGPQPLSAQAIDPAGNVSRRAVSTTVELAPIPGAPTGLAAGVAGYDVSLTWDPGGPSVSGYHVFRGATPLVIGTTPIRVAGSPLASSWSNYSYYGPSRAWDESLSTFWIPASWDPAPVWQVDFYQSHLVAGIRLQWYSDASMVYGPISFNVQAWSHDTWITVQTFTGGAPADNVVVFPSPIETIRLRVVMTTWQYSPAYLYLAEAQILGPNYLVTGTSFTDPGVPDGQHAYRLVAVNACSVEGPASELTTAVGDVTAPGAPIDLTATATGSDVALSWTTPADPDVAGYIVYRDVGGAWTRLNPTPVPAMNYVDPVLPNGTYRYRVIAVDTVGNQSAPSNEAQASVNVPLPSGPLALAVTAPLGGGRLDLAWSPGDPTQSILGYRVYRSTVAGGPYVDVGQSVATTYADQTVTNGTTYYYVVRAADAAGNESAASNESSGTPRDTLTPEPPVLLFPTDAAHPIIVTDDVTLVGGTAEPGAVVRLLNEGISLGATTALSAHDVETVALPTFPNGAVAVSAADAQVAYFGWHDGASAYVLTIVNADSGDVTYVAAAADGSSPVFTPDGSRIAYARYDGAGPSGYGLFVYDLGTGSISRESDLPGGMSDPAFSSDGDKLAFSYNSQIWAVDLTAASPDADQVTSEPDSTYTPLWSNDGATIFYITYADTAWALRRLDTATGIATDVAFQVGTSRFSLSRDGATLAYESVQSGRPELWLYDVASGAQTPVPPGDEGRYAPLLAADGASIVYISEPSGEPFQLRRLDPATGASELLATDSGGNPPSWTAGGSLLMPRDNTLLHVRTAGSFQFNGVGLAAGDNVFSAIAIDAAGNPSAPADPITVTLDVSARPDLAVTTADVFAYPLMPTPTERVRVAATIRNAGASAATNVEVVLYALAPSGALAQIGPLRTIPALAPGASSVVSADWLSPATGGRYTLVVVVDPVGTIAEVSETNNTARRDVLLVSAGGAPTVSVRTDHTSYSPSGRVYAFVEAANPGVAADFDLEVTIEDEAGFTAATLLRQRLAGFGYAVRSFAVDWSAVGVYGGAYRARARLVPASGPAIEAAAAFVIETDAQAAASVSTDRSLYQAGDLVSISGLVRNTSVNADLADLVAVIEVIDAGGTVVSRTEQAVARLLLGGQARVQAQWASRPGVLTARLRVMGPSGDLAAASAPFSVLGVVRLEGQVLATPAVIAIGEAFTIAASASNSGTLDANAVALRLRVASAGSQAVVRTFDRVVDLPAGSSRPWQVGSDAAGLAPGAYTVTLEAVGTSVQSLANGALNVADRVAPTVSILTPSAGAFSNADVAFSARAADDASGVDRVEYRVDNGPWTRLPIADLAFGRYATLFPGSPTTEGAHTLTVRAFDNAGNGDETSSSDANPVSVVFTIDVTPPSIDIAGVVDGVTYGSAVTPMIAVTDANLATQSTLLNGAAFTSGTQIGNEGSHVLTVTATDLAGNASSREMRFVISATSNQPPTALDDHYDVQEGAALGSLPPGVLANDLDADDPTSSLVAVMVTPPANGTFTLGSDGGFAYGPNPGFSGTDQFIYRAQDPHGAQSNLAVVTITVIPNPRFTLRASAAPLRGSLVVEPAGTPAICVVGDLCFTYNAGQQVTLTVAAATGFVFTGWTGDCAGQDNPCLLTMDADQNATAQLNAIPAANAGPDQTVQVTNTVTLDGGASTDADGDSLTFEWSVVSRPVGSAAVLSDSIAVNPAFYVDRPGAYVLSLVVRDGVSASEPDTVTITTTNSAPVANAGPDQTARVTDTVRLDGGGSSDVDGDPLAFRWTITAMPLGSLATLSDPSVVAPTFRVDLPGEYVVELVVHDGAVDSAPDGIRISTENTAPVAIARASGPVRVAETVLLDGGDSFDVDGDPLTFRWALTVRPADSAAVLSDATAVAPTFVADVAGAYVAQLIVTDGAVDSPPVTVSVTTENTLPVADAGPDQTVPVGATATLDGAGSFDADGNSLTYRWALTVQPAGSAAVLSDPTAPSPSFVVDRSGTYVAQLIVNDGTVESAPDTVTLTTVNSAPVANAGADQTVAVGSVVQLDGGGSSDADGDALTYQWALTVQPAGSTAAISDPSATRPTFTADQAGTYVAQLMVGDGLLTSSPDTVTITATSAPSPCKDDEDEWDGTDHDKDDHGNGTGHDKNDHKGKYHKGRHQDCDPERRVDLALADLDAPETTNACQQRARIYLTVHNLGNRTEQAMVTLYKDGQLVKVWTDVKISPKKDHGEDPKVKFTYDYAPKEDGGKTVTWTATVTVAGDIDLVNNTAGPDHTRGKSCQPDKPHDRDKDQSTDHHEKW
ncbi:MAG: CARDB domain-containing protein [Nitrospirota bacterium]